MTSLPYGVRLVCVPTTVLSALPGREEKVANMDAVSNVCVKGLNVPCKGGSGGGTGALGVGGGGACTGLSAEVGGEREGGGGGGGGGAGALEGALGVLRTVEAAGV